MIEDMREAGFVLVEQGVDGHNLPRAKFVHGETKAEIDRLRNAQQEKFADGEQGYIRLGPVPKGGRSRNFADDRLEDGVSCFRAVFAEDGSYLPLLDAKLSVTYHMLLDRPAWRLWGEEVGTGSDGEPLLKVTRKQKLS